MDFFGHQDAARKKTGQLILFLGAAVLVTVAAVYTLLRLTLADAWHWVPRETGFFEPLLAVRVAFVVLSVILVGSVYKTLSLNQGGRAIASLLGGRELQPNSGEAGERRLLNVVEEMALAAGVPVPTVFLLDEEKQINAFAAGFSPAEAVIGVTRGAVEQLSRDELQGVIAHEFSHIVNGDMKLNLRVVGLVHGILVIALIGQALLRGGANTRKGGMVFAMFGLALIVIGYLGVFFARLIKAALSRQREFLADASAVQFTRNPGGLAGALAKIAAGGSKIGSKHAEEASHFFFASGLASGFLSTHPPLEERLARLDPSGELARRLAAAPKPGLASRVADEIARLPLEDEVVLRPLQPGAEPARRAPELTPATGPGQAALALPAAVGQLEQRHVEYARELLGRLPAELQGAVREPLAAQAVVLGLLLDRDPAVRERQSAALSGAPPGLLFEIPRLQPLVLASPPEARLPLLDLALPALSRLSPAQYTQLAALVEKLVEADQQVALFELALQRALLRHLGRRFDPASARPPQYFAFGKLEKEISVLLAALAHATEAAGHAEVAFAAGAAVLRPLGKLDLALLPPGHCDLRACDGALKKLDLLAPRLKKPLLGACAAVVAADRQVTVAEAELLRVIADTLGCPVPPLLAGQRAAA